MNKFPGNILNLVADPKKLILTAVILVAVIVIGIVAWRKIRNTVITQKAKNQGMKALQEEIAAGGGTTYGEFDYMQYANNLYDAMKGLGTDEAAVMNVIKSVNTKADLLMIIQSFAVRDGETLSEWLHSEMSGREIDEINRILSEKGIRYLF
jgi:predicted PurR-regulated permease PerM